LTSPASARAPIHQQDGSWANPAAALRAAHHVKVRERAVREVTNAIQQAAPAAARDDRGTIVAHPAGCPGYLFCGCGVCVRVFGHPCARGGLAIAGEWAKRYPRTGAAAGTVAVFYGRGGAYHVAYVEQASEGRVLLWDANSGGGLTRLHWRSEAGLIFVRPTDAGEVMQSPSRRAARRASL
jgi:hypothetical protein